MENFNEHLREVEYDPFSTAKARTTISTSVKYQLEKEILNFGDKVLDYGSGRMMDVLMLTDLGIKCSGYDKYAYYYSKNDEKLLKGEYNVVMCNYIFETIKTAEEHFDVLDIVRGIKAKRKIVALNNDFHSIRKEWEYMEVYKCYYTGTVYQRFFDFKTLYAWFGKHKVLEKKSNHLIIELL
ncbi:hypothetical protein [uncultured Cetobacterium sp.]|uniref:hypothetical protein n=1 Tax=uncultured Cetobacterium sp. TaxID=527638 RepID=UPI002631837C|nr:hypothetical protein [uncultured Cetobacterium sp.]